MPVDLTALRSHQITDLVAMARRLGLDNASNMRKQELVFEIVRRQPDGGTARGAGVLEILPDGFGFLRSPDANFLPGSDDIYVSPSQIRRFNLRTGDFIEGRVRSPKEGERYFALIKIERVNERSPEVERGKLLFDNLTPVVPHRPLKLAGGPLGRLIDAYVPLAMGQRVLVLAEERAGRTTLLSAISQAASASCTVLLLLIDERPEDITTLRTTLNVEIISTTLDEPPARHVQVVEMAFARARRLAEQGRDVVLLIDSLTRLARAVHANADRPAPDLLTAYQVRGLFAAGRQLAEGGSLTVVGPAVVGVDPGASGLVEELRGAATAELFLLSALADGMPGLDVLASSARHQDRYLSVTEQAELAARRSAVGSRRPAELVDDEE